jgi:hypothetical protein
MLYVRGNPFFGIKRFYFGLCRFSNCNHLLIITVAFQREALPGLNSILP